MAERLGFEPRKELPLCRFSRPVLSTAQPSLRVQSFISIIYKFNKKKNHICIIVLTNRVKIIPFKLLFYKVF